jgi:hypothetical protein
MVSNIPLFAVVSFYHLTKRKISSTYECKVDMLSKGQGLLLYFPEARRMHVNDEQADAVNSMMSVHIFIRSR